MSTATTAKEEALLPVIERVWWLPRGTCFYRCANVDLPARRLIARRMVLNHVNDIASVLFVHVNAVFAHVNTMVQREMNRGR